MEVWESFGETLKKYRKTRNISQEKLAHRCDLDRTYISLIERGKRNATVDTLFKICSGLDVQPSEFIKEVESLVNKE